MIDDEILYRALEKRAKTYVENLEKPEASRARAFLEENEIRGREIGYVPIAYDEFDDLSADEATALDAAGILSPDGDYDLMKGRVVLPVRDVQGRAVGFVGRTISRSRYERNKWLVTPNTSVFTRENELYALDVARQAIQDAGCAIVVKDCFECIKKPEGNAVATMGLNATQSQIRSLMLYADEIVFDSEDEQYLQNAAETSIEWGANAWIQGESASNVYEWYVERIGRLTMTPARGVELIARIFSRYPNRRDTKEYYEAAVERCATVFGVDYNVVRSKIKEMRI